MSCTNADPTEHHCYFQRKGHMHKIEGMGSGDWVVFSPLQIPGIYKTCANMQQLLDICILWVVYSPAGN